MIFLRKVSIRELGLGNIRCEVQLAVKAVPNGGIHVTFRHPSDEAFSHAIILGAQSVIDRFLVGSNVAGIDILVLFIWKPTFGQPHTDIVSMLTAQCTCAAFGVPDFQMPYFDREKRRVIYPI